MIETKIQETAFKIAKTAQNLFRQGSLDTTQICLFGFTLAHLISAVLSFRHRSLESTLILSATITTLCALLTLPQRYKQLYKVTGGMYVFMTFITIFYTKTNSIVGLFIFYELFLLPSTIVVWLLCPSKRGKQACFFFVVWTQLGSFLILIGVLYIRYYLGVRHFYQLKTRTAGVPYTIQMLMISGFLFKIPTFPFYFWLTKTHVEAPTSFSIFLSGFLVKIAIFGIYKFLPFYTGPVLVGGAVISIIGAVMASITFLFHMDFKRLIAYSTIQEMGVFSAFLFLSQTTNVGMLSTFLITHTLLSIFYFSTSEALYKKCGTRSYLAMTGLIYTAPKLTGYLATSTLFFRGMPGTAKFAPEVAFTNSLFVLEYAMLTYVAFFILFLGNVLFSMAVKRILVFSPLFNHTQQDASQTDMYLLSTALISLLLMPILVN